MAERPRTIDQYFAGLDPDQRAALQKVRAAVKAAARHCAFHPMSGAIVAAHKTDLAGYDTSPGTIRFQPSHPPPGRLIRLLVKARILEMRAPKKGSRGQGKGTRPREAP